MRALLLISAPPPDLEPSETLREVWRAEEEAYERGDIDGALDAVVAAGRCEAPAELRARIVAMQRRVYEHGAAAGPMSSPSTPSRGTRAC